MNKIIKINILSFGLYFLIQILNLFTNNFLLTFAESTVSLFLIFIIFSFNLIEILKITLKTRLSLPEQLTLMSLAALIIAPLILTIEYTIFNKIFFLAPVLNSIIVFIIWFFLSRSKSEQQKTLALSPTPRKIYFTYFLKSPLLWAILLNSLIIIVITSAYQSLPDLDPYGWLIKQKKDFADSSILDILAPRPLFESLSYIFNQSAKINLHSFFKYGIPILSILTIIPAWLVAKNFKSKIKQLIILLFPLANASSILYIQTAMPQAMIIIVSYYVFYLFIYSWLSKKELFYYVGGIVSLLSVSYHEIGILLFLPWLILTLYLKRKLIYTWIARNRLSSFLILLILLLKINFLKIYLLTFIYWLSFLYRRIFAGFNFKFPAEYVNVDGNAMGWSGLLGITKYYSYYVGPVFFIILITTIFLLFTSKKSKAYLIKSIKQKELLLITIYFIIFFSISEIFPRFFSLAFLPERAWIWGGMFSFIFLTVIFKFISNKFFYYLLILSFLINAFGAIYINNSKKYMITPEQLESAQWIKNNLPEDRIILNNANKNLLNHYSESKTIPLENDFYLNPDIEKKINETSEEKSKTIKSINECYRILDSLKLEENIFDKINSAKNQLTLSVEIMEENIKSNSNNKDNLYIYCAKEHPLNPYSNRPYQKNNSSQEDCLIFNKYPQKFEKVYQTENETIIIWEVL